MEQLLVGDPGDLTPIGFKNNGDLVGKAGLDVFIQAVVGGVQKAIVKPLVEGRIGLIEDPREGLLPDQLL